MPCRGATPRSREVSSFAQFVKARKSSIIFGLLLLLSVVIVSCVFSRPSNAASPKGEFFIPVTAIYQQQLGVGAGLGWQQKSTGLLFLGQFTYTYCDGVDGTVNYQTRWKTYQVPYSTGQVGVTGFQFTLAIPLRKAKH